MRIAQDLSIRRNTAELTSSQWSVVSETEEAKTTVMEKRRTKRHRPKPPLYQLDTLCGSAPKFRRFCWRKNVGKGESHGPKNVKPSPPCISLLWDGANEANSPVVLTTGIL